MSIVSCRECHKDISTTARACPHCGAKVPRFKWWLWVPLGLVAAFIIFAIVLPESEGTYASTLRACEKMGGSTHECQRAARSAADAVKARGGR